MFSLHPRTCACMTNVLVMASMVTMRMMMAIIGATITCTTTVVMTEDHVRVNRPFHSFDSVYTASRFSVTLDEIRASYHQPWTDVSAKQIANEI